MVAAHHPEVATARRKMSLFDVLYPGAEHPDRNIVFLLAGDRAGMTSDTSVVINDEAVAHQAIRSEGK
jgi:hypothetical protein